jgi:hypothetical protein
MPTPSALSLRLQIVNRLVVVLQAITAGATYWVKPYEVLKRDIMLEQAKGFPVYMVYSGSDKGISISGAPDQYDEVMQVLVEGYVKDMVDPITALEKSIQDVRLAINTDSKSGAAGTLGTLSTESIMFGPVKTDEGLFSADGFGYFSQPVEVTITGDFGVL